MYDVAAQLSMNWARHGRDPIIVTIDFAKCTLDTIAPCSTYSRFNIYYKKETHLIVEAMSGLLVESSDSSDA